MNVEAYFENIPVVIAQHLESASQSIQVAVAWFTDKELLRILCERAKAGVTVELMLANDPINRQYGPDYEALTIAGGRVYIVGKSGSNTLMHNKFVVIDFKHTITGSYNWSYRAQQNHENITVTTDATDLALQYYQEFNRLKAKYVPLESRQRQAFDLAQLLTRFEVIIGLLRLGELAQAQLQIQVVREYAVPDDVREILNKLDSADYAEAARLLGVFRTKYQSLVHYDDEEVFFLKLELKALEQEVVALENEKTDYERSINEFVQRYHTEFGDLLLQKARLQLQYDQLKGRAALEQTKTEYESFREQLAEQPAFQRPALSEEDENLLKKRYRKAVMLCHPDKAPKEHEAAAQALFVKLTTAYEQNDLVAVTAILEQVESGTWANTGSLSDSLTQRHQLRQAISQLQNRIEELKQAIDILLLDTDFANLPNSENWDTFVTKERENLQIEITLLQSKIAYYESQQQQ